MEEKERYIIDRFDEDIFDTKKEYYPSNQTICEIINKQDKRIKELEQENLFLQEQSIRDNQNWIEETTRLKQQLHDLPKKIVKEVEKNFTEYLPLKYKTGAWFYGKLNEILKKYEVEDE